MQITFIFLSLILGVFLGLALAGLLRWFKTRTAYELAEELYRQNETMRKSEVGELIQNLKANFGSLSLEALSKSTEELLKLAQSKFQSERESYTKDLETKKGLIDQQLTNMNQELEKVTDLMKTLENDRVQKFGQLESQLKNQNEQVSKLSQTAQTLKEALAGTKTRGQLGEKLAEDVLRLMGFIENVNYQKQRMIETEGTKPDFTFLLPKDLKLNMDVKFPLSSYLRHLEAPSKIEKDQHLAQFLKDVRARVKEITSRDYINPAQNTLDYVLLFIPNEQVYAFIQENDASIFDDALKTKVVFCSPLTLYAILAVIRQAIDNFALEKASKEMLSLFGAFRKQWTEFVKKMETLGKKIDDAQETFASLMSTRQRELEKPLNKIEELRKAEGLPLATIEEIKEPLLLSEVKES